MKKLLVALFCLIMSVWVQAQENTDPNLKVWFTFNNYQEQSSQITDMSGNGFVATLKNGAIITDTGGTDGALSLGSTNGFLDLGADFGNKLLNTLDDFTISTYLCIASDAMISGNGNFVFSFGNSEKMATDANGSMFFAAKDTRYAISKTHWAGEQVAAVNQEMEKGKWKHLAISYSSAAKTVKIYIDGTLVALATNVSLSPKALGTPAFNFIGKSSYALNGDAYLKKTLIDEFRIYNISLPEDKIISLGSALPALNAAWNKAYINECLGSLELPDGLSISTNITLPTSKNGVAISWSSSAPATISSAGVVKRPASGSEPKSVTLTATATIAGVTASKEFKATVIPALSDIDAVKNDTTNLQLTGNVDNLRSSLTLPSFGLEGSTISWISSAPKVLSNGGAVLNHPEKGKGKTALTITATIAKGSARQTKAFKIQVAEKEGFAAYLFAYFTGNNKSQEACRFAISKDGYTYTALNDNQPILDSSVISSTGGIRDPHILRGADGKSYYMVATDMVSAKGWNSNRAMILMKSTNLIDWQTHVVNIQNTYSGYSELHRVWAPQTIYDEAAGKYLVYWSMQVGGEPDKIYYAYANSDFSGLESEPQILFQNPNGGSTIDADIVKKDGLYYLFFKTEGDGNGIKKAVSSNLTSGYALKDRYLQSTTDPVEGGCVFRLYDTDTWILMYDMYTSGAYQFTETTDFENFKVVDKDVSFNFGPRHGTIIPITADESAALMKKWGGATRK